MLAAVLEGIQKEAAAHGRPSIGRQEVLRQLDQYGHPTMVVGAGAAMVLHGLRDSTDDIDVNVPRPLFKKMHEQAGSPPLTHLRPGVALFTIPGTRLDVHSGLSQEKGQPMAGVNGRVMTSQELLAFYTRLNRPKDQRWIEVLRGGRMMPKTAAGQGSFAQGMKKYKIGRGVRNGVAFFERKLRSSKKRPLKALAYTLKDMSMPRALATSIGTAPLAWGGPQAVLPGLHPAAIAALNAPGYIRQYRRLGSQSGSGAVA